MLLVRLVRTSPTHHRLELHRADGSHVAVELATRSFLLHDLVHFAVESEAGCTDGFFGRLACGGDYAALATPEAAAGDAALMAVEQVVGPLQGAWRSGAFDAAAFVARLREYLPSVGATVPPWCDEPTMVRVAARLRQLEGQWRATRFGDAMELRFGG